MSSERSGHVSSEKQAVTPARHDDGTIATNHMPLKGRGDTITLAHPEGSYMQIHRKLRHKLHQSGEFGEWIEDAALHNPLPHL